MKIKTVLVAALSAGSVFAQSPKDVLDARIQFFGEMIRPTSITVQAGTKDQADRSAGLGIRFMGEIASARNWYYEVGGKLDSSSQMALNNGVVDLTDIKITHSYWSLGAGYLAPLGSRVSLGFHLEARGEALSAQGAIFQNGVITGRVDASNTYLRPWARVSLDGTWNWGNFRPYVGVDVAGTPVKTTQTQLQALSSMDNRTLRAMAPQVAGSFYLGCHF
ncbi:hypothetical protein [Mesoterricola silvestris]|uniref:Uncharacterized protein n=1 Tax=Mesoterricola silvestris TaxID=2927979 RepID=A0AA48GQH0_9BACT|nr:hypothetical protein [Mesoterricola silvestris]BDU73840.1 hypothetical protein METEAL_30140 [Mesoterricola silvestris]